MSNPECRNKQIACLISEQRSHWAVGKRLFVEHYLERYPDLKHDVEGLLDFIYAEYCLREELGDALSQSEYESRFPQYTERLKALLLLHKAMRSIPTQTGDVSGASLSNKSEVSDVQLAATIEGAVKRGDSSSERLPGNRTSLKSECLNVRCPNCHLEMEIAVDTMFTDLTCESCGSHFSLVDQSKETRLAPSLSNVGRFELIERLGLGGFGSVWKARDKELDRTVAIKIPRAGGMTSEDQEKFFREARAAAQLHHSNIVSVHEVGRDGDTVYIVSDFVRGVTLSDWLTGQQLTSREAAELCVTIADALHHAHEHRVIHRDLKPANIIMDYDGQPHLMDFGLARRESGEITVTMDGHILGTPAYMSPEQAEGMAHTADRRSDVYSLGVILFQLLTGELPFRGNARMLIKQVISDEPPSPRKFNGSIHRDLETITLKCLEKDPTRRYQSARELSDEVRRFLGGQPIHARPIGTSAKLWRWCVRNPQIAVSTILTIVILFTATIISWLLSIEARKQSQLAQESLVTERNARQEAIQAKEQALHDRNTATRSLYYAQLMALPRLIDESRFDQARRLLLDTPRSYRSWEWGYFQRLCHLDAATIELGDEAMAGSFSPDGSAFALAGKNGRCLVYSWPNLAEKCSLKVNDQSISCLAFSPDGRVIATGHSNRALGTGGVTLWETHTGRELLHLQGHQGGVKCIAYNRDGKMIATGGYDGTARLWNSADGSQIRIVEKRSALIKSLAFSPTSDLLACADKDGDNIVRIWNSATGEKVGQIPASTWGVESLLFSPDGKSLVTGTKAGHILFWDTDAWKKGSDIFVGWFVWALAFTPDGKHIACGWRDPVVKIISVEEKTVSKELRGHGLYVNAVSYSRDGDILLTASSDGTGKIWNVSNTSEIREIRGDSRGTYPHVISLGYTPDGKSLAIAATEDKFIRIRDTDTDAERMRLGPYSSDIHAVDFINDGSQLVTASDHLRMWNLTTGATLPLSVASEGRFESLSVNSNRNLLAVAWQNEAIVWNRVTDRIMHRLKSSDLILGRVLIAPDGSSLVTTTTKEPATLCIWNLNAADKPQFTSTFPRKVYSLAFSPNGKQLAIATGHSPSVIDGKTGRGLFQLVGHGDVVSDVGFSPDGKRIVTVTVAGSVSIWDAENGTELLYVGRVASSLYCAKFSPDGRQIAVGGISGSTPCVWLLNTFPWHNSSGNLEPATIDGVVANRNRDEFEKLTAPTPKQPPLVEYHISSE